MVRLSQLLRVLRVFAVQFFQTSLIVALGFRPPALAEDQPWEAVVQARYLEAERACSQALAMAEKFGPLDKRLAVSRSRLAVVYHKLGRQSEAEILFRQALETWRGQLDPESLDVARALNNLGEIYRERGKFAEAETALRQALTLRAQNNGSEDSSLAAVQNNLAKLFQYQGKYLESAELLQFQAAPNSLHVLPSFDDTRAP